jgi:hypothetical protein
MNRNIRSKKDRGMIYMLVYLLHTCFIFLKMVDSYRNSMRLSKVFKKVVFVTLDDEPYVEKVIHNIGPSNSGVPNSNQSSFRFLDFCGSESLWMHFERWICVDVGCCEQWSFGSWQKGMFGTASSPIFVFVFFGLQQDCARMKFSS